MQFRSELAFVDGWVSVFQELKNDGVFLGGMIEAYAATARANVAGKNPTEATSELPEIKQEPKDLSPAVHMGELYAFRLAGSSVLSESDDAKLFDDPRIVDMVSTKRVDCDLSLLLWQFDEASRSSWATHVGVVMISKRGMPVTIKSSFS